jgi:hypothetical protein
MLDDFSGGAKFNSLPSFVSETYHMNGTSLFVVFMGIAFAAAALTVGTVVLMCLSLKSIHSARSKRLVWWAARPRNL